MNNYTEHFEKELKILKDSLNPETEDNLVIEDFIPQIRKIIEVFGKQGHSGFSAQWYANILANTIKNTLLFKPLSPLTGKDNEWIVHDYGNGLYSQNKRNSAVFKEAEDGKAYFIDAIVFQGEDEFDSFTGSVEGVSSKQYVKEFPFTAKTFTINVKRELYDVEKHGKDADVVGCGDGDYVYFIKDPKQLEEVWEYYDKYE